MLNKIFQAVLLCCELLWQILQQGLNKLGAITWKRNLWEAFEVVLWFRNGTPQFSALIPKPHTAVSHSPIFPFVLAKIRYFKQHSFNVFLMDQNKWKKALFMYFKKTWCVSTTFWKSTREIPPLRTGLL